jgi:hypothetical protein
MKRRPVAPPAECRAAADAALTDYSPSAARPGTEYARAAGAGLARDEAALAVYTLGVEDVVGGARLSAPEYAGWQFFAEGQEGVVGTEVHHAADRAEHRFAQFNLGPFPTAMLRAMRTIPDYPDDGFEYEARLLRIPALLLEALWLHSGRDVLVPLDPAPAPLVAGEPYESDRFFTELQTRALESLRSDNSPRTGSSQPW